MAEHQVGDDCHEVHVPHGQDIVKSSLMNRNERESEKNRKIVEERQNLVGNKKEDHPDSDEGQHQGKANKTISFHQELSFIINFKKLRKLTETGFPHDRQSLRFVELDVARNIFLEELEICVDETGI